MIKLIGGVFGTSLISLAGIFLAQIFIKNEFWFGMSMLGYILVCIMLGIFFLSISTKE